MHIVILIILVLAGIIALLLLSALFMRKEYAIDSEIIIDAPRQKVFEYLKQLKNQDSFNKWVMVEPDMKREFKGTDGMVGFIYAWSGNKAGEGEQEIKKIVEGDTIETEIRFVRPFRSVAVAIFTSTPVSDRQTKVTWSNTSKMKYPLNMMLPMIEKMLAKDMSTSLSTLKAVLEK